MKTHLQKSTLAKLFFLALFFISTIPSFAGPISSTATGGDWNSTSTWVGQVVPGTNDNVTIENGATVTVSANSITKNIIVASGGTLIVTGTLKIGGVVTNYGTFTVSDGTLEFIGASTIAIPANVFTGNTIKSIIAGTGVNLQGPLRLTGTLSFGAVNNITFTSADYLTLASSAAGTARIADITNGGVNSGNTITDKVTIERYIPMCRAWRLLSAPVLAVNAPTINAAWQEGVTTSSVNSNPNPGYGTHITGGVVGNGFDQNSQNNPSLKVYNPATGTLSGLTTGQSTLTTPITNYPGYFLFIRGNRSNNLGLGTGAPTTNTTLRINGGIIINNVPVAVNATNYTLVGNPYPSAINFGTLTKANVNNRLYQWDPKMSGYYGLGAYVAVSYNAGTGLYDATSSVSSISQYVQSGEAFFVQSTGTAGTLTIKETDKTASGSDFIFRTAGTESSVRPDLYEISSVDSSVNLIDGVLATYNDINSNSVDNEDAPKLNNLAENLGILRDSNTLSIERRLPIIDADTLFLKIYQMKVKNYRFKIDLQNIDPALEGKLLDNYSSTINNTPLNLSGVTEIDFNVNNDAGSYASDRFSIVFKRFTVLPVLFKSINAYQVQKNISVNWAVDNELNIVDYEVQGSQNGMDFSKKAIIPATQNNGSSVNYSWTDVNPMAGLNFYRIAATENSGAKIFSSIVKVNSIQSGGIAEVVIYPLSLIHI